MWASMSSSSSRKLRWPLRSGSAMREGRERGMGMTPRIFGLVPDLSLPLWRGRTGGQTGGVGESVVQEPRKGVRGVEGYGGEEGVVLVLEEFDCELAILLARS